MTDFERLTLRTLSLMLRLLVASIWSGEGGPHLFTLAKELQRELDLTSQR